MKTTDFPEPFDGMPLLNMNPEGEVPPSRLAKPAALRNIFTRFRTDDDLNAIHRAQTQDLLDGGTPYEESELTDQPDTTNLNFEGAEQQLERAMAPYHDMVSADELLVAVRTLYGADDEREGFNEVLSEEISDTIRDHEGYPYQTTRLAHKHVWDGLGVAYWPDDIDWRYRADGMGQFFFPRKAMACESEMEIICSIEEYAVTRLYKVINAFDKSTDENKNPLNFRGWNIPMVREALLKASSVEPAYQDWERLQEELKNNDLSVANSVPLVRVINGWVIEFKGRISHYMTTEAPCGDDGKEKFMYVGTNKYRSMREALILFPYGIGSNTKIHGIRGLGKKIYAFEQQRNRSLGRLIDQGLLASSLMLKPGDENALSGAGFQYYGNTAVLEPDIDLAQYTAPDLQRTVMPVLQEMERLRNERTTGYSPEGAFDGDQRKTKFEVGAKLQADAQLSGTAQDFWNRPFERLLQQTVRRMTRRNYVPQDPGGEEIADLHLRLVKRGVPLEALYKIDVKATKFVRAIGGGSASARTLSLSRISELRPRMDDKAQAKLDRKLAIDAVGVAQANEFFPADGVKRTTIDTNMAAVESILLIQGNEIAVQSSDKHLAHAREHFKPLIEAFQAEQEGQIPIEQVGVTYRLLYQHNSEHVDRVSGDPSVAEEAAAMRRMMQQIGEVISNGLKKAQSEAEKQAAEGGGEGQQDAGPSDQDIRDLEKHRKEMEYAQEKHEVAMQQLVESSQTKRSIADAEAAAKIARETALARAKAQITPKTKTKKAPRK